MTYSTASTIGRTIQSLTNSYELVDEFKPGTPKHLSYSESVEYCERCKGLDECQYGEGGRGYQALQEQYTFGTDAIEYTVYTKCHYLLEHEAKARKKRLFDDTTKVISYSQCSQKDLQAYRYACLENRQDT